MLKKTDLGRDAKRDELLTRKIALMIAANKSDKEITDSLDVSQGVLDILRGSPLFEELITAYSSEIEDRGLRSIIDELDSDAPANLNFIRGVRDGNFTEPRDRMDARLSAAKMLLDKQAPNADARVQNERAAHVIIDGRVLSQVLRSLRNVGVLDITPEEIETATGESLPRLMGKTPDDYAADYKPDETEEG